MMGLPRAQLMPILRPLFDTIVFDSEMSSFSQGQGNQGIPRRRTNWYAAQGIPQIDAEIAEKGHFWMKTS
jgi:hypothetical protein